MDHRRLLRVGVEQQRRGRRSSGQFDIGDARQRLEPERRLDVGAQRRGRIDPDGGDHDRRVFRIEPERADIADLDAVEVHRATDRQARHGPVEDDLDGKRARTLRPAAKPVDERESDEHRDEYERADRHIVRAGFHAYLKSSVDPARVTCVATPERR